jgi:hypothetical protein
VVSTPLKNICQLGLSFPIYAKIKNVPNHQPVIININIWQYNFNPRRSSTIGKVFVDTSQNWMLNDVGGRLVISHEGGMSQTNTSRKLSLTRVEHADHWCNLILSGFRPIFVENNPRNSKHGTTFPQMGLAWKGMFA